MYLVMSWLIPIMAYAPKAADKAKSVPFIWKAILPILLVGVLLTVVGITVLFLVNLLSKRVPLEDEATGYGALKAGEMTQYEDKSRIGPILGKIGAAVFIIFVIGFMYMGLYTMGRGSGTTEQLQKEGKEKQARIDKRKAAAKATGSSLQVGEDGDSSKGKKGEFGGLGD